MAKAARSAVQTARHNGFIESINYGGKSDDRSEFRFSKWCELTTSLEFRERRTCGCAKRSPEIAKGNRGAFIEHRDVIVKFGRYPHRNAAMGRETTPEEKQWLESKSVPGWARSQ